MFHTVVNWNKRVEGWVFMVRIKNYPSLTSYRLYINLDPPTTSTRNQPQWEKYIASNCAWPLMPANLDSLLSEAATNGSKALHLLLKGHCGFAIGLLK